MTRIRKRARVSIPSLRDVIRPHSTYGELRRLADGMGLDVWSRTLPMGICGYYCDVDKAIVIDREQTYRLKRCAIVHELVHWSHRDGACGWLCENKAEYRTRRETAGLLIDEHEYATAETMYDADARLIANELDVTLRTVEDYRNLVLSRQCDRSRAL